MIVFLYSEYESTTCNFTNHDHGCLLNILNSKPRLDCIALQWFDSYLKTRSYPVSVNSQNRFTQRQDYLMGFCLGRLLFNVYATGIEHLPQIHCYDSNSGRRILNYIYHLTRTPAEDNQHLAVRAMEKLLN